MGKSFFSTVRVEEGRPLFWPGHRQRLLQGLAYCFGREKRPWEAKLQRELLTQLKKIPTGNHFLRPTFWENDEGTLESSWITAPEATLFCEKAPIKLAQAIGTRGKRLVPAFVKLPRYTESWPEINQAQRRGFSDILWTSPEGHIQEASTSNIFWACQGQVVTPPPSGQVFLGLARSHFIRCLQEANIPVAERQATKEELLEADCVWLTNALKGLWPVEQFEQKCYHEENFFHTLRELFKSYCLKHWGIEALDGALDGALIESKIKN